MEFKSGTGLLNRINDVELERRVFGAWSRSFGGEDARCNEKVCSGLVSALGG